MPQHPERLSKAQAERIAAQMRADRLKAKREDAVKARRRQEGNR